MSDEESAWDRARRLIESLNVPRVIHTYAPPCVDDDNARWRVAWTDHATGAEGIGKPVARSVAEAWVAAMNAKYPTMTHWIVPA